jgi:hypothetical protein
MKWRPGSRAELTWLPGSGRVLLILCGVEDADEMEIFGDTPQSRDCTSASASSGSSHVSSRAGKILQHAVNMKRRLVPATDCGSFLHVFLPLMHLSVHVSHEFRTSVHLFTFNSILELSREQARNGPCIPHRVRNSPPRNPPSTPGLSAYSSPFQHFWRSTRIDSFGGVPAYACILSLCSIGDSTWTCDPRRRGSSSPSAGLGI